MQISKTDTMTIADMLKRAAILIDKKYPGTREGNLARRMRLMSKKIVCRQQKEQNEKEK